MSYNKESIISLEFRDAARQKIAMYLGSADMEGAYHGIQEILSNSIDEYIMGFGDSILIEVKKDNAIKITDRGRGVPFGIKEDGTNTLEAVFSKPHTGGKFNDKNYSRVVGLNGIGAKATCLSSEYFEVTSTTKDGLSATAIFVAGYLVSYNEQESLSKQSGTEILFKPDPEVFNLEPIKIEYDYICKLCKGLTYLTKGLTFTVLDEESGKKNVFCSMNGIVDLISDTSKDPIHANPIVYTIEEDGNKVEIAVQWTKGPSKEFCFTNGVENPDGGTPITGLKTSITRNINKYLKTQLSGSIARIGLVMVANCSVKNPSFANQTKNKINNAELRSMSDRAFAEGFNIFINSNPDSGKKISEFLLRQKKAEDAANRAREVALTTDRVVQNEIRKKSVLAGTLADCKFHDERSQLLIVEGESAGGGVIQARDSKTTAVLPLRGKLINVLKNSDEDIFDSHVIKKLQIALGLSINQPYNSKKIRYGRVGIMTDADKDGYSIMCLILTFFYKYYRELLEEGRVVWARTPLFKVETKSGKYYACNEEELSKLPKGDIVRMKG